MIGYEVFNLLDILAAKGDEWTIDGLQRYSCPLNSDVEDFLRNKAITFAKQRISSVWPVFPSAKGDLRLAGYFALANKLLKVAPADLTRTMRKRIAKFAAYDSESNRYVLAAPLIGQLGKNYYDDCDKLITGDELLQIACDKIIEGQRIFGGRVTFVECEDVLALVRFYERNDFHICGDRLPTREESNAFKSRRLIQLLKYLHT